MKNKTLYITLGIFLILIIGALVYFYGFAQSFQSNLPLATASADWNGNQINIESIYLGSVSSGQAGLITTGGSLVSLCSSNDAGYFTISNNYNINGQDLILTSDFGAGDRVCDDRNYIKTMVHLPKGTLHYKCELTIAPGINWVASSFCNINGILADGLSGQCDRNGNCQGWDTGWGVGKPPAYINEKTVEIEEGDYEILLETQASVGGNAHSKLTMSFEEATIIPNETNDTIPNETETTITIYRLENNQCHSYIIETLNKLTTDYSTLSDCQADMIPDDTIVCGNGLIESGEQCDDGNKISGDGCSSICKTEGISTWVYVLFGSVFVLVVIVVIIFSIKVRRRR
jgi:cysteine-rich repeat protein